MSQWYRRDGSPYTTLIEWANDFEKTNRRVCETRFWWGGYLSTVWLGLDHQYGDGPPLIFETMLFRKGVAYDHGMNQWRYSTEREAIDGHSALVRQYRSGWKALLVLAGSLWFEFEMRERQDARERNVWSMFDEFCAAAAKTRRREFSVGRRGAGE